MARSFMCTAGQQSAEMMRQPPDSQWGRLDPDSEIDGFGQCLWNYESYKHAKALPLSGCTTLTEVLENCKAKHSHRRAVGQREVVKVHMVEEGNAMREKIELANEYKWMTYAEYYDRVLYLARGLNSIGVKSKSKLVIYAETQVDWMVTAFASWFLNVQVVTIYATLGEEGAIHGINETEAATVVADERLLKILAKVLPKCKEVKNVITMKPCKEPEMRAALTSLKSSDNEDVRLHDVEELCATGKTAQFSPQLPSPDDVAVIMYTSGTTAKPKGVMISHANVLACMAGVEHSMVGATSSDDVYLCYLPLAHIFEMGAEIWALGAGMSLGYGTPHTLTDTGVKLKRPESSGDAVVLQPTFMVFAPAVLDKIYQAVQNKRNNLGGLGKTLFNWGISSGEKNFDNGNVGANRVYNKLVFSKVQTLVGGRLKCLITGSAPLSPEIQKFVQTVLDVPARQGYGLTETCAGSCVAFWGDNSTSSVGPPTANTVIRLADWPEGNYLNSDKDKPDIGMRRGEVLIGGPGVTLGYFIDPKKANPELETKNKEDYVTLSDGIRYFRTGDVGQIKANGTLQIIDRKKDLWKGPQGEYVALTKVESALKLCEFVDMPMVYGRTGGSFVIALICPQKPRIIALGRELGIAESISFERLCLEQQVVDRVSAECKKIFKAQKLAAFECPEKFALISDLWTPENDMLTAAMKLKRPLIVEKHKDTVDKLYSNP